jgi:hypothetical protein
MNTRFRAKMFELSVKRASESKRATAYFQFDPKTRRYRGIIEVVETGDSGIAEITFVPEKPIIGQTKEQVNAALKRFGFANLQDGGESTPWYAESNMPFDEKGNRVY